MSAKVFSAFLVFGALALVALTGFLTFKPTGVKKSTSNDFSDIDETYVEKKCLQKDFSSFLGVCNKNKLCKPGLYCSSRGVCLKEKVLGSVCSRDTECSRSNFNSVKCILGTCGVVRGEGETCEINDRCSSGYCSKGKCQANGHHSSYSSDVLNTNYCSNYLNSLNLVKSCMLKNCGNDGTSFGYFIDTTETCPVKKCSIYINAMKTAAFEEFSTKFDEQGEVISTKKLQPATIALEKINPSLDIKSGCQSSQVEKAEFGISGSDIYITFTNPLDTSAFSACSNIGNVFTNVTTLGTGSTCSFPNAKQLRIVLGTSPSIKPQNSLSFKNVLTVKDGCSSTISGSVSISSNAEAVAPIISLVAPAKITTCDSLSISASGTTGSGQLSYEWTLDTSGNYISSSGISNYLVGLSKSVNSIQISTSLLKAAVFGKLKIDLTVIDYFGQVSNSSAIVELSSNTNDPQVYLSLPSKNEIIRNNGFTLSSSLIKSSCLSGTPTNVYSWKVTPAVTTTTSGGSITVPKYTLVEGTTYTFTLDVSVQQNGVEIGNSTSTAVLTAVAPPVIASIAGQSPEGISSVSSLSVDASGSSDPNIDGGVNTQATFAWTCCSLNTTTGVCNTQQCLTTFSTLSQFTGKTYTQASPLTAGKFVFTVTYTAGQRSAKASKTVVISPGNLFVTLESISRGRYTFSTNVATPTWSAEVESGNFTIRSYSGSKFIVDVPRTGILISGALKVSATSSGQEASLEVPIEKPTAPFGGSIRLLFINGTTSPNQIQTGENYIFEATGWKGSGDLYYEFFGTLVGAQSFSTSNKFSCSGFAVSTDTASSIKATISVYSKIYEEYISTEQILTVTVLRYVLPAGKNYAQAANETLSNLDALTNSGDTTGALQAVGQSLNILQISSGTTGTTERKQIKEQISKGLETLLTKATTISESTKLTVVDLTETLVATATEYTAEVKKNVISGLVTLFSTVTSSFSGNTKVMNVIEKLVTLTAVSLDSNQDIQSTESLSQTEVAQIKSILRGVARSSALAITDFTAPGTKIDSTSIKMQVNRFAFSVSTTELTLLSDNSVKFHAPSGIVTSAVNVIDLYTMKFPASLFPYVTSLTNENISTPIIAFELYNGDTGNKIAVVNNPSKILFTIDSTSVKSNSNCRYINEATTRWDATGVNITTANAGTSVVCDTTHLTDFAGFDVPQSNPTTPTQPNTPSDSDWTSYLALLLLLIPIGVIVLILVVVAIGAVVFVATTLIKKNKSESVPLNTQAAIGLEDLGI